MTDPGPDWAPHLRPARDDELPEKWRGRQDQIARVFGHNAAVMDRWNAWYRQIIADGAVSARLKEIVRLRVAQLNACNF
jgi:alkylhydroperoxidase family enzyme